MRNLFCLLAIALLFSACNSLPDHARYIPSNAMAVVSVNFKNLGKDIAWSKIVGSDILDDLEKKAAERGGNSNAVQDLEKAGLRVASTAYLYVKHSAATGNRAVAIIPLNDREQWAAYVKKTFPQAAVRTTSDKRSESRLSEDLYAGWDDEVLLVMNTSKERTTSQDMEAINDTTFSTPMPTVSDRMDDVQMGAEMQQAFSVTKDESLISNKRFKALEGEGHDMGLWVNYEGLMTEMAGSGAGMMAMYANLYKGTALAAGFDFEKGQIEGEARYYTSEALKDAFKQMGSENVDKDLLDRVPAQNLNALLAWNFSPKSMRAMLEKMNLLGIANMALGAQGFSVEDIIEAFEGDMIVALNDFRVKTIQDTVWGGMPGETYDRKEPQFNYIFSAKIGKKENLEKLISWGVKQQALTPQGTGLYAIGDLTGAGSSVLMVDADKDLLVFAKDAASARTFMNGKASGKMPEVAREAVYGHPMGAFFDVQTMLAGLGADAFSSQRESLIASEFKRAFSNFTMHSEGFKNDAFHYEMDANMVNKTENSLVQLIDLASRIRAIDAQHAEPPTVDVQPIPFKGDTSALVEPTDDNAQ